ncbi:hypothetical protein GEMRC1_004256 [Eukaryota sp. GEM-RC1]
MTSVQVFLYDISFGMAKSFSPMLLGPQNAIDIIPHTSVCVYNTEYFFGMGIQQCPPLQSGHGNPVQFLDFGQTEIPQELFQEWLRTATSKYSSTSYNLLELNCNNFTNDAVDFLVGNSLPSSIIELPQKLMATPLGAMVRPMIEQFFAPNSNFNS